jgi:hypothetical protein
MLRRSILVAPLALAACNGASPSSTIATIAQDVQIIGAGLSKALTRVQALNVKGLSPELLAICQTALANIQTAAVTLSAVSLPADAQPLVVKVEGSVNAIVGTLSALPLPAEIQTALVAATILLPVIEAAVNLAVPSVSQPMTADQARATLKG